MLHELSTIHAMLDPSHPAALALDQLRERLESAEPDELDRRLAGLIATHCRAEVAHELFRRMAAGRAGQRETPA